MQSNIYIYIEWKDFCFFPGLKPSQKLVSVEGQLQFDYRKFTRRNLDLNEVLHSVSWCFFPKDVCFFPLVPTIFRMEETMDFIYLEMY